MVRVISTFALRLIGATIIFFLGLVFGNWARRVVDEILNAVRFDEASQKSRFERYLKRAQVGLKAREIIAWLAYWFVVLVFFIAAVNILGWRHITMAIDGIIAYIPKVLIAAFILAIGWIFSKGVELVIRGAVGSVETKANRTIGVLGRYAVVVFAFLAALDYLEIPKAWTEAFLTNLGWTITIALGIALGWGAKDTVAKILTDWYANFKKEMK